LRLPRGKVFNQLRRYRLTSSNNEDIYPFFRKVFIHIERFCTGYSRTCTKFAIPQRWHKKPKKLRSTSLINLSQTDLRIPTFRFNFIPSYKSDAIVASDPIIRIPGLGSFIDSAIALVSHSVGCLDGLVWNIEQERRCDRSRNAKSRWCFIERA
jgi:hypothetical protein